MTDKPTICAKCVYFFNRNPGSRIWHDGICLEPKVQPKREPDYVFGGLKERMAVHCRDVNKGDCPHFEPKA
jgi:hypothetical protein